MNIFELASRPQDQHSPHTLHLPPLLLSFNKDEVSPVKRKAIFNAL